MQSRNICLFFSPKGLTADQCVMCGTESMQRGECGLTWVTKIVLRDFRASHSAMWGAGGGEGGYSKCTETINRFFEKHSKHCWSVHISLVPDGSENAEDLLWTAVRSPQPPGDARALEWCSNLSSATHITTAGQCTTSTKLWWNTFSLQMCKGGSDASAWGSGDGPRLQERKRKWPKVHRPFPRISEQSRVPRSPGFIATLGPRRLQTATYCWRSQIR